ncbi:MAG: UDP-N-acetylglucosamine 2-epimerase (non-hydrolyzing) [Saprospirales bacterium]|nr:MAG: UDP-N-acetylglucosamine 2-epimerase (non-hydrolyzing) [Saprospirales bacterium]
MRKILLVFGTRPEAIKMAPLVKKLREQPETFKTIVTVTGQHRQMLDQVLKLFDIQPDYDLDIMKAGQNLFDVTSRVLNGMKTVIQDSKPDLILVHGDTATSTAAALAGFYCRIPIGHVEAGLRTYDMYNPWPEEINRQLTGRLTTFHFAPTEMARQNLLKEQVPEENIIVTGNTVIDALYLILKRMEHEISLKKVIHSTLERAGIDLDLVQEWEEKKRRLILITGHRRENFGSGFVDICEAIRDLAKQYKEVDFLYPVHLNPNVQGPVNSILGDRGSNNNIYLVKPLDYLEFVYLLQLSHIVLTDSGGIQEEAPGLGKPVLVMRTTTERPEALNAGTVKLVGTDKTKITSSMSQLLDCPKSYQAMSKANNPYGDGKACERIVRHLENELISIL